MLVLRSTRVVFPDGERAATLHIDNGLIDRIADYSTEDPTGARVFNAGDDVVFPGLVDTHVHVNEPGRTAWEGFDTATRAAAAGGVTTIVDMPLNSVPATTTADALRAKHEAARAQCHVDVAFWGGVVPGNTAELDTLIDDGVRGFKCFLVPSGVDEFPSVGEGDLRKALPVLARRRVPLLVHAELPEYLTDATQSNHQSYPTYLATRPPEAELEAIRLMVRLAEEFKTRVHIVHVSSAAGVQAIAAAKAAQVPITAETCPHYLTFTPDDITDGATEFKCAPPIREADHRSALWDGLESGALDMIVTDHSPSPPALKQPDGVADFLKAWGGIASLELSLPATWSAYMARVMAGARPGLVDLARWMCAAPAALAGFGDRKGRIAPGFDADLVVWNPDARFVVDPAQLRQRHKITPYASRTLAGRVLTTFVRGERVWDRNQLARAYGGRLL
jgi:allantoinase